MKESQKDFYQKLRKSIREFLKTKKGKSNKWSEYLLLAPDLFHLLCKLIIEKDVPKEEKAKLGLVIAYFVFPFDFFPEGFVGPIGYLDDIVLSVYVLNGIMNKTNEDIIKKHWAGEDNILDIIKEILAVADDMIGASRFRKIKNLFKF